MSTYSFYYLVSFRYANGTLLTFHSWKAVISWRINVGTPNLLPSLFSLCPQLCQSCLRPPCAHCSGWSSKATAIDFSLSIRRGPRLISTVLNSPSAGSPPNWPPSTGKWGTLFGKRCGERFFFFFFSFFLFLLFRAKPAAYRGSQAKGQIRATAAGLRHSHSNTRSLTPWARPGIKATSLQRLYQVLNPLSHHGNSWILIKLFKIIVFTIFDKICRY